MSRPSNISSCDHDKIVHDYFTHGMAYHALIKKYETSHNALKPIIEDELKKREKIKRPVGSKLIAKNLNEIMQDIECLYAQGDISYFKYNQYKQQIKSK